MDSSEGGPPPNAASKALYEALAEQPCALHFRVLPDPIIFSDYYAIVKKPVCLTDMFRAMSHARYTLGDMQRDIRRMIANAKKYNKPEAVVYQDALELERVTRRLVKEIERDGPEDEDEDSLCVGFLRLRPRAAAAPLRPRGPDATP